MNVTQIIALAVALLALALVVAGTFHMPPIGRSTTTGRLSEPTPPVVEPPTWPGFRFGDVSLYPGVSYPSDAVTPLESERDSREWRLLLGSEVSTTNALARDLARFPKGTPVILDEFGSSGTRFRVRRSASGAAVLVPTAGRDGSPTYYEES